MSIVAELEEIRKRLRDIGYWTLTIPSDEDYEIIKCLSDYQKLSKGQKLAFKNDITYDMAGLLIYFSERMATLSLRSKEQNIFESGLYALDVSSDKRDFREILMILSLYYDVSNRNKLSFDSFINQKEALTESLMTFINRNDKDKTLECMGYILTRDENNNPIYQRTW